MIDPRASSGARSIAGFTLVEVMLMIVIGIILASVALPNVSSLDDQHVAGAARVLQADLEFARARALATSQLHRVSFDAQLERYTVESPPGTVLDEPLTKKPWQRKLASRSGGPSLGIASANFDSQAAVVFDAAGRPSSAGVVVLQGGKFQAKITVTAITGEVTLELP